MCKRMILALALLALSVSCLPSANAATPAISQEAMTSMQQGTHSTPASATPALWNFFDWWRDHRQTQAPEMPNLAGQMAAAFLAFLGYLAIRRRHAYNS